MNTADEEESLKELAKLDGAKNPLYADNEYSSLAKDLGESETVEKVEEVDDYADGELKKSAVNGVIGEDIGKAPEDFADNDKSNFSTSAKVFGISDDQMESEFKTYKAGKLFKKLGVMLTDPYMRINEFENSIASAIALGLDSVSVLPNRLSAAIKTAAGKINIYVCVSFPYAVDDHKTKLYSIKKAVKSAAYGVELPLNVSDLSERKIKAVVKEYKKYRSIAKNKDFVLIADIEAMSPTDVGSLAKICREAGVKTVKTSCALNGSKVDEYALNNLRSVLGNEVKIIAASASDDGKKVIEIFASGADVFSAPNAISLAKSLKDSINA